MSEDNEFDEYEHTDEEADNITYELLAGVVIAVIVVAVLVVLFGGCEI